MRVIQLARFAAPYPGSFIAMVRALCAEAEGRGWSSDIVLDPAARDRDWYGPLGDDVDLTTPPPGLDRRGLEAFVAGLAARDRGPVVLHTHFTGYDLPAAAVARRRAGTAVVWHLHTRLDDGPRAVARNALKFGLLGRGVDRVVCAGPDIADAARRRLARRLEVFANAIDAERFPPAGDDERRRARAALGLPLDRPVLAHFGWDWAMKGGDLFVAAAREVERRGTAVVPVSIGASATGNGLVTRPPTADVRSVYAAADVFVSSSPEEGSPFSVLEALSVGTPVVASPRGTAQLAGQVAALRVAERTPEAFADQILATLERRPDVAAAERDASRQWVLRERELRPFARRMADVYADIIRP